MGWYKFFFVCFPLSQQQSKKKNETWISPPQTFEPRILLACNLPPRLIFCVVVVRIFIFCFLFFSFSFFFFVRCCVKALLIAATETSLCQQKEGVPSIIFDCTTATLFVCVCVCVWSVLQKKRKIN